MRKLYTLLSVLMVAAVLLAACQTATPTVAPQSPTNAPTTAPTVAPTAAAVATTAPTVAAPTAVPTVAPTAGPTTVPNPYIGSGKLDGNGIPPDFFSDVHIRKAFSYSFDWKTYINDVYNGEAVQSLSLIMPGMPGYDPKIDHYTYDLDKAAAEFKLADVDHNGVADGDQKDGGVWNVGFRLQMLYNQGNTTRQIVAEIMASSLASINDKFKVEVLGLPWPTYLASQRAFQIPIMTAGWLEDIAYPNNWVQPYTIGAYGGRQNLPADLGDQFKTIMNQALAETDPAKAAVLWKQADQLYYDNVPGVPLVLSTGHGFEQKWVQGRVLNPLFPGIYYYGITKAAGAKNPATFTFATIGDIDTLDPALAYDTASGEIIQNVYETLVFYKGDSTEEFIPQLATEVPTVENGGISADGKTWTFKIRPNVKFSNGDTMTPSDVAYSLQRALLQGGTASPIWLYYEAFFGTGISDIAELVDPSGKLDDDRASLSKADPAKLASVCKQVQTAVVADDKAGTVTFNLAQPWSPMLPTIAQTWGSVMDQKWVVDNKGWNGSCDTWQNFYAMDSANDPFTSIAMGTGPYTLDHRTPGQELQLTANPNYWRTDPAYTGGPTGVAKLKNVFVKIIPEWGTRFSMLQTGDADVVDVPVENRSQADAMVGETCTWNNTTNAYDPCVTTDASKPLRVRLGRPGNTSQDVVIYNFAIH